MKRCNHSQWLGISTEGNVTSLLESDRPQSLLANNPYTLTQHPSLFVFIGNVSKALALQHSLPAKSANRSKGRHAHGEIHLHLEPSSAFSDRPIFIADSDIPETSLRRSALDNNKCHETITRPLLRNLGEPVTASKVAEHLYARLLHPFADVFCLFSTDLGGLRAVSRHIASWLEKPQASILPNSTFPSLVVVTESSARTREGEIKEWLLRTLSADTSKSFSERFSGLDVIALPPVAKMSNKSRHRRLRDCLLRASDRVRKHRATSSYLFSARHFNAFLRIACEHFASGANEPFDFITAARKFNPVAQDLKQHLSTFLSMIKSPRELIEYAVPMIASSFFLDSYPPDAPLFDPSAVLEKLYKGVCYDISREALLRHAGSTDWMLPSAFFGMIETQMRHYFEEAFRLGAVSSALETHRSVLQRLRVFWLKHRSRETCLVCLKRKPFPSLPCGHIICENCVSVFGRPSSDDPWMYHVDKCFLCGLDTPDAKVRIHPPTAGASILSMDGGGVRGELSLALLKMLEDRIGLPMPILRHFKVVFGTSSGGISALGLSQGWSIQKCAEVFPQLAKVAFQRRNFLGFPLLPKALETLVSLLADCLYPAANIESALKEAYGEERGILELSYATSLGTRVGIPVATLRGPSLCLFTNYNGVGSRTHDTEYHVLDSYDTSDHPLLWQIARAASAAPWFFKPVEIGETGTFQDPGQLRNNPIFSALSEAEVLFPFAEEPDFVVSIGTGGPRPAADGPCTSGSRGLWIDGSIPRCARAFGETMRSKRDWQALTSFGRPKSSGKYHRLDIEFDGPEPRLDGVGDIPSLQSIALENPSISSVLDNIARCARASLFYFELDAMPKQFDDGYVGSGSIQCDLPQSDRALPQSDRVFEALIHRLRSNLGRLFIDKKYITGFEESPQLDGTGKCSIGVSFAARTNFSIYLREGSASPCHISGSPFSVEKLVRAQNLEAHFGRPDHRKRNWCREESELPDAKRHRSS